MEKENNSERVPLHLGETRADRLPGLIGGDGALLGMPAATRTLAGTVDGWTDLKDLNPFTPSPAASEYGAMAALPSGDVMLFDGISQQTWIFNTATNTWEQVFTSSTPSVRSGHAMATLSGIGVLLFGGDDDSTELGDTWLFNTATCTWGLLDTGSASPTARERYAMAALPTGDVLLFGGKSGGSYLSDTWLFNTIAGAWTETNTPYPTNTPTARWKHAMASTLSGALLFGGDDGHITSVLGDTWLYSQATPPPPAGMPGLSPWALALLSLALLGTGGWWFSHKRRLA